MIEIIYHGNITSNIAAGILVRRRFITGRIERAILKRMFRARTRGTYSPLAVGERDYLEKRGSRACAALSSLVSLLPREFERRINRLSAIPLSSPPLSLSLSRFLVAKPITRQTRSANNARDYRAIVERNEEQRRQFQLRGETKGMASTTSR